MAEKPHVLLVDDDPFMIQLERHQLGENDFRFSTAGDGELALMRAMVDKPDVILLDILMPVMDGLEACRRLRSDSQSRGIHVILVTSLDDEKTRKAAFEAGADDLIIKPIHPQEIRRKVKSAIESRKQLRHLREEVSTTRGILMSAMSSTGEYGVVLNAFRAALGARSLPELAETLLKALDEFSLAGSIQLRLGEIAVTLNSARRSSPLEQEMLRNLCHESRRITDFGPRTVVCYPNVTLQVRNMPVDNPDLCGRLRDNLASLAEGAEVRLQAFADENRNRSHRETLASSATLVRQLLQQVDSAYRQNQIELSRVYADLDHRVERVAANLGFTDDQEALFVRAFKPVVGRLHELHEHGLDLDEQLSGALRTLQVSLDEVCPATQEVGDMLFQQPASAETV